MKKFLCDLFAVSLTLLLFGAFAQGASAKIISSETSITIAEDEVIDDDLFIAGETVTVEGTINGDLYAAGGMVTISGIVNGDVLAAGGMVTVSGVVKDDVRIAGGNLTINGAQIGDSLNLFGGNVVVDDETKVGGSVVFGSGNVNLGGDVGRGVVGGGGAVTIDGKVGKNVEIGVGNLTLGSKARVGGDLVYTSEEDAAVDKMASVSGEIKKVLPEVAEKVTEDFKAKPWSRVAHQIRFGVRALSYFAAFVIGFLLLYLFRDAGEKIVIRIKNSPGRSLGWGLLVLILMGPFLLLLAITGVGIPLALILAGLFAIELYLVKIFIGILLGRLLAEGFGRKDLNIYLSFAIGLAVYYVLTSLPIVGFFLRMLFLLLGLGAIFSFKRELLVVSRK